MRANQPTLAKDIDLNAPEPFTVTVGNAPFAREDHPPSPSNLIALAEVSTSGDQRLASKSYEVDTAIRTKPRTAGAPPNSRTAGATTPNSIVPTSIPSDIQDVSMFSPEGSDIDEPNEDTPEAESKMSQEADEFDIQGLADKAELERVSQEFLNVNKDLFESQLSSGIWSKVQECILHSFRKDADSFDVYEEIRNKYPPGLITGVEQIHDRPGSFCLKGFRMLEFRSAFKNNPVAAPSIIVPSRWKGSRPMMDYLPLPVLMASDIPCPALKKAIDFQAEFQRDWQETLGAEGSIAQTKVVERTNRNGRGSQFSLIIWPTSFKDFKKIIENPVYFGREVVKTVVPYIDPGDIYLAPATKNKFCQYCETLSKHSVPCPVKTGMLRRKRFELGAKMIASLCGEDSPAIWNLGPKPLGFEELRKEFPVLFPVNPTPAPIQINQVPVAEKLADPDQSPEDLAHQVSQTQDPMEGIESSIELPPLQKIPSKTSSRTRMLPSQAQPLQEPKQPPACS